MTVARKAVLWFLSGSEDKASARLHGYLIHRELQKMGLISDIVFGPSVHDVADFRRFRAPPFRIDLSGTVSVIQKLEGASTEQLISWLKRCGSMVVYVGCDIRPNQESWRKADLLFVTSDLLRDHYRCLDQLPAYVIKEPFDFLVEPSSRSIVGTRERLSVAWFGNKGNWASLAEWREILESEYPDRVRLVTCSNHPDACVPWSVENLRKVLSESDFAVLPVPIGEASDAKSPNRLVQCMAAGLPTVAGALRSYLDMKAAGAPVLIATTADEFRQAVNLLLSREVRTQHARTSFSYVENTHSPTAVAADWARLLALQAASGAEVGQHRWQLALLRGCLVLGGWIDRVRTRGRACIRRFSVRQ